MKLSDDELPVKDVPPKHSKKDKKKNKSIIYKEEVLETNIVVRESTKN